MAGQLIKPPMPVVSRFELPPQSIVHYIGDKSTDVSPNANSLMYQENSKPLRIHHVFDVVGKRGNPRKIPKDFPAMIREFRTKNPRFRPAVGMDAMAREPRNILTVNYGYLQNIYKYQRTIFTLHFRWQNVFETMFAEMKKFQETGFKQYIEYQLPAHLPTVAELNKASAAWTNRNMLQFVTKDLIFLVELWKWLGPLRLQSDLYKYLGDKAEGVHLVLREGDRFSVVNLGIINQWRKATNDEVELYDKNISEGITTDAPNVRANLSAEIVQKRFLRLLMSVSEARVKDVPEYIGDEEEAVVVSAGSGAAGDSGIDSTEVADDVKNKGVIDSLSEMTEDDVYSGYDQSIDEANLDALIDNDLELMQELGIPTEAEKEAVFAQDEGALPPTVSQNEEGAASTPAGAAVGSVVVVEKFPIEPMDALKKQLERAADAGTITAADYRRYLEQAENFKNIPAPMGQKGSLADFVQVAPALVNIGESPSIPDQPTIVDKTMLKSSLIDFNGRYTRDVMQRDVAGMITHIQRSGIIIKDYQVKQVDTIVGSHYEYAIQIKPIEGAPSTLSIKIPVVKEDGTFKINSVNYSTRMQRGDLPIRKIGPDSVALTSYYGKVFAERSQRRVNDWGKWLRAGVMARGIDPKETSVTMLVPGNAFNSDEDTPRLYSTLSQGFRSFTFTHEEVAYSVDFKKPVERPKASGALKAAVLFAVGSDMSVLHIAGDGVIYKTSSDNTLTVMPGFEEMIGLNPNKSPVEFAELKVFGKYIPIGVILGYLLGMKVLLAKYKNSIVRTVPAGKRVGLIGDEWAIVFDDITYIFSRSDVAATMVLGGWREFYNSTSRFISEEFDHKDVYFNLFEEKKLNSRYMRELDLLEQLFVDPITRELLMEMKEPVVFTDLLYRCCELLCSDKHPNELDPLYMRQKGYERFAGLAYTELVRSIRIHNGRPGKQRYGVDLNPYAVWTAIQQDPAKDQVSEINPIQNLKEQEAVTYSGTGGRGSRSMVKATRIYHKNDMGVISESTVDSSDVGINIFTSADPQFNSLRGTVKEFDMERMNLTSLLSTSALISPGSTRDD